MNAKDTIYADIDDEITTIIDKVRSSEGRVVALVLPKRATVFQSIVNMKLLKRSAEAAKKHVVLITTEASLMPLAGTVGLYVAATPQSKPEVPDTSEPPSGLDETVEEPADDDTAAYTAATAGHRPVGELAQAGGKTSAVSSAMETVSLPDEDGAGEDGPAADDDSESAKQSKGKHLKVPNFNKFRMRLFLGGVLVVVIVVGLYLCLAVLPKAAIAITTNASNVNVSLNVTLDTAATSLDTNRQIVPAKTEQQQKTTSQQVATTGQQNNGTAATGSVTMTACEAGFGFADSVPAGTGISVNGLTYITQGKTTFSHSGTPNGTCFAYDATAPTSIAAQSAGAKYNVDSVQFSVAGRSDVTASGSASGGTDDIIKVVAQADIDGAQQKLAAQDTAAVKSSLEQALRLDGMYPLPATFNAGTPIITNSNNVGDQADNVTVTQAVTYTMYGAKQSDLDALIKSSVDSQINTQEQAILNDGLANAKVSVTGTSGTTAQITLQTVATVGPDIKAADIKRQAAGKKIGDVKTLINNIPGVTNVDVRLSPFWVGTVPTNGAKVTVTISGAAAGAHGNG